MEVQAIKKPRKTVKLYGKQFSTQQMGMQVSCGIHAQVPEEDRLLGNAGGYPEHHPGFMQMEGSSNFGGEGNAGPHPSGVVDTTEVFRIQLHGISEGEKCDDEL